MGQTGRQLHTGLGGRDTGKGAKMSHVFADSQQHSFFVNRLLISTACQQAVSARLVLANQRQIKDRSRECWSDVNCLIGSDAVRDLGKRNLNTNLSPQVVAIVTFVRLEARVR